MTGCARSEEDGRDILGERHHGRSPAFRCWALAECQSGSESGDRDRRGTERDFTFPVCLHFALLRFCTSILSLLHLCTCALLHSPSLYVSYYFTTSTPAFAHWPSCWLV